LLLACDGLWDVCTHEEAAKIVHEQFQEGKTPEEIATFLCTEAIRKRSEDNVTVVITKINWEENGGTVKTESNNETISTTTETTENQKTEQDTVPISVEQKTETTKESLTNDTQTSTVQSQEVEMQTSEGM